MVYSVMRSSELQSGGEMAAVKTEIEDHLEEEHGPLHKRSKFSPLIQQEIADMGGFPASAPPQYNPLDEPSPLGLRLRKSPSLLELIQMRLSQGSSPKAAGSSKKEQKGSAGSSSNAEKLKASNFPATVLRIGTWEYKSRYEGDLVAKCYFAKHKLVWEVLDGGLKNKIEIQWSDIMGLKATYPEDGPGTLDVVLARQPLFFRETNPQPRKHTLWQATSDFTGGQASIQRRHFLECPQGLLGKHFEKLIQCDPRLNFLSQQPEINLESPCFEARLSVFDDPSENRPAYDFHSDGSPFFNLRDAASPSGAQSSSSRNDHDVGRSREPVRHETPSPSSVMDTHVIEEIKNSGEQWKELSNWDQIKVPGLHTSMSMSDLVSHLENRISEQRTSNNVVLSNEDKQGLEILDEISRYLFSDSQYVPASDENSLMTRVNSLCCLLQRGDSLVDLSAMDTKVQGSNLSPVYASGSKAEEKPSTAELELEGVSEWKQTPSMSRKDSVGELLLNLPRIASLPQFLFNISEDVDNQAR
ncbi:OLC1v1014524C1 [Oldenlandia corymbosa var. corymbosa]|uniref:OLC1v1014524C1 n=1 Tax=Oldenlandia corymbosa var. corymbosa TaxID=529605 RepID=A0AAV1E1N6_OLDCO|nr:OLC1v1014524C1 [Oldenlandia corymbosa var. corymbosa]